jgi:GWxTD domain-containing protein
MAIARRLRALVPLVLLLAGAPRPALGEIAAVDPRRFPDLVRLLLLPEERALLKELKGDEERRAFQQIFWARRDPTPGTAENELEAAARATWKRADELFSYPNQRGSETGCGQVLLLLGRPEDIRAADGVRSVGTSSRFDNLAHVREGTREAETWVYRDRPGRPFTFTRAELLVAFDPECRFSEGGILADDLRRAASALVTRPEIGYRRGADGRLVRADQLLGGGQAALDLLSAPRTDFGLTIETKLVTRGPRGAFVGGLARIARPEGGAAAPARASLAFRAEAPGGTGMVSGARESRLAPAADGSVVASWGLTLAPGRQKVTVAAVLPDTGQGSTATLDLEVPDLAGASALVAAPLLLYPDEPGAAGAPAADPADPYAALQVGSRRLRPRFGNVFTPQDALVVVAMMFGARTDAATGQASLRSRFTVLKDGRPVARGAEDTFTTRDAVASVGPIPLSTYAPGAYVVRLDATDAVGNRTLSQEAAFEVRQP